MEKRYNIYVGQPTYDGKASIEAVLAAAARATRKHTSHYFTFGTSLLGMTFNVLWSKAIEGHFKGGKGNPNFPVSYDLFGMVHADIAPVVDACMDPLIDLMDRDGYDVVSAIVPIKDMNALTSTAIGDPYDDWSVRRLTMTEVEDLPDVVTPEVVGGPLLVNTALWVCRLGQWCKKHAFTINDRIDWDGDTPRVRVQPEDWNFSRFLYRAGIKYCATKIVEVDHLGQFRFKNRGKWGRLQQDIYSDPALPSKLAPIQVQVPTPV